MFFRKKQKRKKRRHRKATRHVSRRRYTRRSFLIFPGVRININRRGFSLTFGFKNANATFDPCRKVITQTFRFFLPGLNYSVTRKISGSHKKPQRRR